MLLTVHKRVLNKSCQKVIFQKIYRCKGGLDLDLDSVHGPCSTTDSFASNSKLKFHLNNQCTNMKWNSME